MASDNRNGHNSEDEAFQKHIQQMLSNGPEADGSPSAGGGAGQTWQQGETSTPTTSVDLNYTAPVPGLSSSRSVEDESPFRSPDAGGDYTNSASTPYQPTAQPVRATPLAGSKLDQVKAQVKEFSIDTFRTTKQLVSEIMGKGTRTVDPQVDVAISELRILQNTYMKLLTEATNLHSYFSNVIYTQKQMTNVLGELAQRDPKLSEDFNMNSETQRVLIRNGEQLLGAISFFLSNMRTLCTKTIQDSLDTAKKYESSRLQYDTYRSEHEQVIHSGASGSAKSAEIRQKYDLRKKKYEQLKADMIIKLQFLEENKNKVVHRQLLLFHNAVAAYFSGNQKQLESVLSQFSIQLRKPNTEPQSWLEK